MSRDSGKVASGCGALQSNEDEFLMERWDTKLLAFVCFAGGNMERFHRDPAEERPQFASVHRRRLN